MDFVSNMLLSASAIRDSDIVVSAEAPRKFPLESLAAGTTDPVLRIFETAASTFMLAIPGGGGNHHLLSLAALASSFLLGAQSNPSRSRIYPQNCE